MKSIKVMTFTPLNHITTVIITQYALLKPITYYFIIIE